MRRDGHYTEVKSEELKTVTQPHNTDQPSENQDKEKMPKAQEETSENRPADDEEEEGVDVEGDDSGLDFVNGVEDQDRQEKGKNVPHKSSNQHEERDRVLVPLDQENHQTGEDDKLLE